ncbi:Transcription-repair-coupling factor [Chromobacterium violaceum]|uniref:Transcription-repair-coupling factor n=1 Tax=Chromobacterium violaceum TaxID=536 RepID=A0A3S4I4V5_CHRVL|nr:Transcription-repair-coupling factor [Chromobacterium violaceum]
MDTLTHLPPAGQKTRCGRLPDGLDSHAIAALAKQRRPLLILAADAQAAQRLKAELPFFAPDLSIALFPDWETLPYDHFSPHGDLVSERLATLWQIRQRECQVVIAPVSTALGRLAPVSYLLGRTFFLKTGQQLDVEKLRGDMVTAGYQHVTQVMAPGEFSVRGSLIDLYPMGSPLPYRIDLFDAEIDSLKTFDPTPSARCTRCPKCACCRRASIRPTRAASPPSASATARRWKAIRARAASTKTCRRACGRPASSTTCRCSSTKPRRCSTTSATTRWWCSTTTCRRRRKPSGATRKAATTWRAATSTARCWRRPTSSCARTS